MIIKKFQAGTEQEAIMKVKEEMGSNAVVLNIKTMKHRGIYRLFKSDNVEVTAALEDKKKAEDEDFGGRIRAEAAKIEERNQNQINLLVDEDIDIDYLEKEASQNAIEEKLNNLQNMLEKQVMNTKTSDLEEDTDTNLIYLKLIYNKLIENEVNEKFANQIIGEVEKNLKKDSSIDTILAAVYQKIVLKLGQPEPIELEEGKTKIIFFEGPTGVGKTTTIAKIASSYKLSKDTKVALITADTYRIAAAQQLKTYGDILGVPFRVIYSPDEIRDAKDELKKFELVLVDTAGRSHRNEEQCHDIDELINCIDSDEELTKEVYLVLSITTKYSDLVKMSEIYGKMSDYKIIFTKLDETSFIGNILNIKLKTGKALSYTTYGQVVPDDISKINPQAVAKQILGGSE